MYTSSNPLVAKQLKPGDEPELQRLEIESMRSWAESYDLLGINHGNYSVFGDRGLLRSYSDHTFQTRCRICPEGKTVFYESTVKAVLTEHFIHCSKEHGYVFPSTEVLDLKAKDQELQDIITASQLYDLPMPGYDDHTRCIKKYQDGKAVCVIHEGNLAPKTVWMGIY